MSDHFRDGLTQGATKTAAVVDSVIRRHVEHIIEIGEKDIERHRPDDRR